MRVPTAVVALPVTAALVAASAALAASAEEEPDPEVVFMEDFSGGEIPEGWNPIEGEWTVSDGRLVGTSGSTAQQSRITFGPHLRNYRIELTVRFEQVNSATRWTAVALDMPADGSTPWWIATMRSGTSAHNGLEFAQRTVSNSWNVTNIAPAPFDAGTGRDVRIAVEVRGSRATWIFDGQPVLSTAALHRSQDGVLGLVVNGSTVSFDDVVVTELDDEPIVRPGGPEAVPAVVAHRGYSTTAPENTLAAFEAGMRTGAEYIETDVLMTADGVPVLLHDQTLDRTTDGTGRVDSVTWDYISGLDAGSWFSHAYPGQTVPRLADLLELMQGRAPELLLELKGSPGADDIAAIIDVIRDSDQLGQVIVQSFNERVLRDARAAEPDLRLALLRSDLDPDPVATAKDLDVVAYNPSWAALQTRPEVVGLLQDEEIAVMPWTLNSPDLWSAARDLGVDGVITDHPGSLGGWNARHVQTVPGEPAVEIVAPADGDELIRGDVMVPAVVAERAEDIEITLDGEAVDEGGRIEVNDLALGEHVVSVQVRGVAGEATASATVTVVASAEGLVRLAAGPDVRSALRDQLLHAIDQEDWRRVADLVESGSERGWIDATTAAVIAGDAHALLP